MEQQSTDDFARENVTSLRFKHLEKQVEKHEADIAQNRESIIKLTEWAQTLFKQHEKLISKVDILQDKLQNLSIKIILISSGVGGGTGLGATMIAISQIIAKK
jgi:hypothetical protein